MSGVKVDQVAIKKAVLHGCKYANQDVIGILVGTHSGNHWHITDAFPISHSRVTAVSVQFAFDVIPRLLKHGESIIGVYECLIFDEELSAQAAHLSSGLREFFGIKKNIHMRVSYSDFVGGRGCYWR
jgi:hypothetical protein